MKTDEITVDHRPWETKILEVLADNQPHSRVEIMAAAARVVDPLLALRALKKTNGWSKNGTKEEGLAADLANGIQIILSKAISYMETRRLVEPVDFDEHGRRIAFRITEQGLQYLAKPPTKKPYAMILTDEEWASEADGERGMPLCIVCTTSVDPTEPGSWSQRLGWVQKRAKGGANRIVKQSAPIAFAHKDCIQ